MVLSEAEDERAFLQPLRDAHEDAKSERERLRVMRRRYLALHAAACESRTEALVARGKMRAVAAFVRTQVDDEFVEERVDEVLEHLTSVEYNLTEQIRGIE